MRQRRFVYAVRLFRPYIRARLVSREVPLINLLPGEDQTFYKCYCTRNTHKCRYPHYTQHKNCPLAIQRETSLLKMNKYCFVVIHTNTITLKYLNNTNEVHTRSYQS